MCHLDLHLLLYIACFYRMLSLLVVVHYRLGEFVRIEL